MSKKDYVYLIIIIILLAAIVVQYNYMNNCEDICWEMLNRMQESEIDI